MNFKSTDGIAVGPIVVLMDSDKAPLVVNPLDVVAVQEGCQIDSGEDGVWIMLGSNPEPLFLRGQTAKYVVDMLGTVVISGRPRS